MHLKTRTVLSDNDKAETPQAIACREITSSYQANLFRIIAKDTEILAVDIAEKLAQTDDGETCGETFLECYNSAILTILCNSFAESMLLIYGTGGMPAVQQFTEAAIKHIHHVVVEKAKDKEIEPFSWLDDPQKTHDTAAA